MSSLVEVMRMPKKPPALTEDAIEQIAQRFAVLAEPMRLKLVHAVFDGEKSVNTLVELTAGTQANVSRHLQQLASSGVLTRRKEGLQVFYAIGDPSIYALCELVCGSLKKENTKRAKTFGS